MEEENETAVRREDPQEVLPEKFRSVEALVHAYEALEAEFTRRSQRLKALEEEKKSARPPQGNGQEEAQLSAGAERESEELYRAVMQSEGVRARVLSDYLNSLRGVPLMTGAGAGVPAPSDRPASIAEAGALALGFLKSKK